MLVDNKIFITETPSVGFPILYGMRNSISIKVNLDLFGYDLRFVAYKEIGAPKILEILIGSKLSFLTYSEDSITKTLISLKIDEIDSRLIPTIRSPALTLKCDLIPTCFYDFIGTIGGEDVPILNGFIQGTPTAKGAV